MPKFVFDSHRRRDVVKYLLTLQQLNASNDISVVTHTAGLLIIFIHQYQNNW